MKISDITTKDELDEALESAMAMATGCMSDEQIIASLRRIADPQEGDLDPARPGDHDTDKIRTLEDFEAVVVAACERASTFMPDERIETILRRKANEYEEECV